MGSMMSASSHSLHIADSAAFANEDGGNIILGMDPDEVTLVGVDQDPKDIRDRLGQLIRGNVVPPDPEYDVESIRIEGKLIVVLEVRPSSGRPYGLQFQGKPVEFYVRRRRRTYVATQSEVRVLASLLLSIHCLRPR